MRGWIGSKVLALAAIGAVFLGACTGGGSGASGRGGERAAGEPAAVEVTLSDFAIEPADIEVPSGSPVTFTVTNDGQVPHTFGVVVDGNTIETPTIDPDGITTLEVPALDAGTYEALCTVPGHADLGMVASVTAGDVATGASTAGATGATHGPMTAEEMADGHAAGVAAFLAGGQTEVQGNQPLKPTIEGGVQVFELWAERVQWEIADGVTKEAMAYNGQVPGPEIRVRPGDRVRVSVQNQLDQPTTLHFHGLTVPNEADGVPYVTQDPIMPGDAWTYEFTVKDPPGMYVYHSHFNSTEQVGKGLYGAFIVEPPSGRWRSAYGVEPAVETDLFLGDGPLDYTLNGKSFPATTPIVASRGDWVLIHMANDGSLLHPMHLHGYHFAVVGVDGVPLDPNDRYVVDTLVVAPGSRYDIMVQARYPGAWAFHCHILPHVEGPEGMFGMVTALVVQ
jgi:uncharacterized cupredoxin-like copper-binding protein